MAYFGGKGSSGVYQTIINQIPRHEVFISAFAGHCSVLRKLRPASRTVAIDRDPDVLRWWAEQPEFSYVERWQGCSLDWLSHEFQLGRLGGGGSKRTTGDSIFVFCDPPYLRCTRKSNSSYLFEMDEDAEHHRLIDIASRLTCYVMICGYPSDLYEDRLKGWRSIAYESVDRGGNKRPELFWMNYPEPVVLHDHRYLGSNKRERERIRRRCRNWRDGLNRMPRKEREAILAEIGHLS